jgi:CPA2 family monovalent cation:H+ antiporter-2
MGDDDASIEEETHERLHSVTVEPGAAAVGKRIAALDLPALGVEVTAVRRRGIRGAEPSPEMVLEAGDVLVLRGVADAVERAEERVMQG